MQLNTEFVRRYKTANKQPPVKAKSIFGIFQLCPRQNINELTIMVDLTFKKVFNLQIRNHLKINSSPNPIKNVGMVQKIKNFPKEDKLEILYMLKSITRIK